jgi:acylphosphatase
MTAEIRRRLLISGRVQGVWFRGSTKDEAEHIGGLKGWVRNLDDGRVEAAIQGPAEPVERLVAWCHRGPDGARVDRVQVVEEAPVPGEKAFRVER